MSIALITTSTRKKKKKKKKRNVVYFYIIHETRYIVHILCTVITTLLNNEINLHTKKCFFQTYTTAIFHFLRSFFITTNVNFEISIKTLCFYISMMKPEAATGGVL